MSPRRVIGEEAGGGPVAGFVVPLVSGLDSHQEHACDECSAAQSGLLFGLPVVLDTDREDLAVGDKVLLTYQGAELAVVDIDAKCA